MIHLSICLAYTEGIRGSDGEEYMALDFNIDVMKAGQGRHLVDALADQETPTKISVPWRSTSHRLFVSSPQFYDLLLIRTHNIYM